MNKYLFWNIFFQTAWSQTYYCISMTRIFFSIRSISHGVINYFPCASRNAWCIMPFTFDLRLHKVTGSIVCNVQLKDAFLKKKKKNNCIVDIASIEHLKLNPLVLKDMPSTYHECIVFTFLEVNWCIYMCPSVLPAVVLASLNTEIHYFHLLRSTKGIAPGVWNIPSLYILRRTLIGVWLTSVLLRIISSTTIVSNYPVCNLYG